MENTVVRSRVYDDSWTITYPTGNYAETEDTDSIPWGAPTDAVFIVNPVELAITEIMYHPRDPQTGTPEEDYDTSDFEFIEIKNIGNQTSSLLGIEFVDGIKFDFTYGNITSLNPDDYEVVVSNLAAFKERYTDWGSMNIAGEFEGSLNNAGENLTLEYCALERVMYNFDYEDDWYPHTDGQGFSLIIANPLADPNTWNFKTNWRGSAYIDGSPGQEDPSPLYLPGTIVINEALTHQDIDNPGDWIELHNTSGISIDITDWYLSDDGDNLTKYRIPVTSPIPPGGCIVFTEYDHFGSDSPSPQPFALSEHGDSIYFSSGSGGSLSQPAYREYVEFDVAEKNVTFGRFVKSDGSSDFTAMSSVTFNSVNSAPLIGPIIFNKIMYNPPNGYHEYLEVLNISETTVQLYDVLNPSNTWKIDGIKFTFPPNIELNPGSVLLLVEDTISSEVFRILYDVPVDVQIFNYSGNLDNDGERLKLMKPGMPDETGVPYITVEMIKYNDKAPWPAEADGYGYSLKRNNPEDYGNDYINWAADTSGWVLRKAANPIPGDGALNVYVDTDLNWMPGTNLTGQIVYFGTDPNLLTEVVSGDGILKTASNTMLGGALLPSTTYYWKVDSYDGPNNLPGIVWSFTTGWMVQCAINPTPDNGAINVSKTTGLSWQPGINLTNQKVYFGTDPDPNNLSVVASGDGALKTVNNNELGGPLVSLTTYYWKVDGENDSASFPGTVWNFTTTDIADSTLAAVDASSEGWAPNFPPTYVIDDNLGTRWTSEAHCLPPDPAATSSNEWIWINLGADRRLNSVSIDFQDSAAVDYTIRLLTQVQAAILWLVDDGTAAGGVDNWTTIATAVDLPNGLTSPTRKLPGTADIWEFTTGTAVIPDNMTGITTVDVLNPIGRYLLIDATEVSDNYWGNLSIWEITVDSSLPLKSDFNKDWSVNSVDLAEFVQVWLSTDGNLPQDLLPDNQIDLSDFALFAEEWIDE
jgi:hypothetical protein